MILKRFVVINALMVTCCHGSDYSMWSMTDETDLLTRCRYRNDTTLYPADEIWKYITGYRCYFYTTPTRLASNKLLPQQVTYFRNYTIPYVVLNGTFIAFDFEDQYYLDLIRKLFKTDKYFNLWLNCSQSAVECCDQHLNSTNVFPSETYVCPALWDAWDCWPPKRAGETEKRPCPPYSAEDFACSLESEKYCLEDDWDHDTNYKTCESASIYRRRYQYHVTVLIISSALTFPAVLIFFGLMSNHKDLRHVLYRNLLISIILKNILTVISKEIIMLDHLRGRESMGVMDGNSVWCRVLTFFNNLATVSVFTCMFVIAYYLHSTIARVFARHLSLFMAYALTVVCSLLPSLAWAISMGVNCMKNCWVIDTVGFHWITDAYKYAVLVGNLILLLDIVRVICFQRSSSKLNPKQTKAAAKAILVLIPLFGIPILLTSQSSLINQGSCLSGDIYYYTAYTVEALQGMVVALLFCYLNKEMHKETGIKYRKLIIWFNDKFNTNFKVPSQAKVTTMRNIRSTGTGRRSSA